MILDPNYASDFSDAGERSKAILGSTKALQDEIKAWKQLYNNDISAEWGGIGTDTLYLKDNEVMKTDRKGRKLGKYYDTLKKIYEAEGKNINDEMKRKELNDRRDNLEASIKNLRESLKPFMDPIKEEGKKFEVDLTSRNKNIPDDVTLRDQFRVLQGFNNIGRERLWDRTRFDIEFGGRPVKFDLMKAQQGYFQIVYENPVKEERYGGTQYDKHIFPKINMIKGNDDMETRKKQVKLAEFMRENLDKPIKKQPKYMDVINELQELQDIKVKRAVEDFVILGNVAEAAA